MESGVKLIEHKRMKNIRMINMIVGSKDLESPDHIKHTAEFYGNNRLVDDTKAWLSTVKKDKRDPVAQIKSLMGAGAVIAEEIDRIVHENAELMKKKGYMVY